MQRGVARTGRAREGARLDCERGAGRAPFEGVSWDGSTASCCDSCEQRAGVLSVPGCATGVGEEQRATGSEPPRARTVAAAAAAAAALPFFLPLPCRKEKAQRVANHQRRERRLTRKSLKTPYCGALCAICTCSSDGSLLYKPWSMRSRFARPVILEYSSVLNSSLKRVNRGKRGIAVLWSDPPMRMRSKSG